MNSGKIFEQQWRKGAKKADGLFFGRFNDSATPFEQSGNARFAPTNICDFYMYKYPNLFLLELKNTVDASLGYSRLRDNQWAGLLDASKYLGINAGIVCNFQKAGKCYYLDIKDAAAFKDGSTRKSIPMSYFAEAGIEIETKKLRTNFDYNVRKFVDDIQGITRKG